MLLRLARLLAPPLCIVCGAEGHQLCRACVAELPSVTQQCMCCKWYNVNGRVCTLCRHQTPLTGLTAAGTYQGVVRELVLGLKFNHQRAAAEPLAGLIAYQIAQAFSHNRPFEVVTSVPTAAPRLRQRGFDHARLLARSVAVELTLPYRSLLYRRSNIRQVGSTRQQRLSQVEGLFGAIRRPPPRILLIDDVTTTGATLSACAQTLRQGGAEQVWAAVAARDD